MAQGTGGREFRSRRDEEERTDRIRAKELEERFKDYKPNVKLEYTDDYGNILNPKDVCLQRASERERDSWLISM